MKKILIALVVISAIFFVATCFAERAETGMSGEELFKKNCAVCHPDGGNIVNPKFTLHKKDLEAHNITKPGDIVNKMRNPGPGMPSFGKTSITDKDAEDISEYILKTFK